MVHQREFNKMSNKKAINVENLSEEKKRSISDNKEVSALRNGVFCSELIEPIPEFIKATCERVYPGKNNNYIVMGRDRSGLRSSGYGGMGDTQASMIDIVVGRMADKPRDNVYVDPNFKTDAARIYISQKSDIDKYFDLAKGSGDADTKSAIAMKADALRFISREGIKIVTGVDEENSQGGNIETDKFGVDIIANNVDSDLQPMVKGNNLVEAMKRLTNHVAKLNGIVEGLLIEQDKLNKEIKDHWHISAAPGHRTSESPVLKLVTPITIMRHFSKTKTSLRTHRTNLENFQKNYLSQGGRGYINSRYNKVN